MSQSVLANVIASGFPSKQSLFIYNPIRQGFDALNVGYLTSGTSYLTGSSIIVTAVSKTGIWRLNDYPSKKAVFINQRDPMYRVYKNNESGLDYLRWIPANSGGWHGRAEIAGIQNLNELAIQIDNTATSTLSGVCIAYS